MLNFCTASAGFPYVAPSNLNFRDICTLLGACLLLSCILTQTQYFDVNLWDEVFKLPANTVKNHGTNNKSCLLPVSSYFRGQFSPNANLCPQECRCSFWQICNWWALSGESCNHFVHMGKMNLQILKFEYITWSKDIVWIFWELQETH